MRRRYTSAFAILVVLRLIAAGGAFAQTAAQCDTRDLTARPFGPAMQLADTGRIYSYTLSPNGRELYFFKRVGTPQQEDYRIFRATRTAEGWSEPARVVLNGDFSDLYPSLSPDGQRLVFASYRPAPGDTFSKPNAHIWMARRTASGWSQPEYVAASRFGHYHSGLQQDRAGSLHFRLTTPDWSSGSDQVLHWNGRAFEATMSKAATSPAADYWRSQAGDTIHVWGSLAGPNGMTLLQVSRILEGGRRSPGVFYVTYFRDNRWTPLATAAVLSRGAPNFAWFSRDGCYLHYTRDYSEFMRIPVAALTEGRH